MTISKGQNEKEKKKENDYNSEWKPGANPMIGINRVLMDNPKFLSFVIVRQTYQCDFFECLNVKDIFKHF